MVACINSFHKNTRCRISENTLKALKPDENSSEIQRNRDESMTSSNINL